MRSRSIRLPHAYLSRASLAHELEIGESTIDDLVRRGVLPKPIRLSSGCVRWRWQTVDEALMALSGADGPASDAKEAVKNAIEASKTPARATA
jgi:predicted DNA-binding transcriptional regulator AlpA